MQFSHQVCVAVVSLLHSPQQAEGWHGLLHSDACRVFIAGAGCHLLSGAARGAAVLSQLLGAAEGRGKWWCAKGSSWVGVSVCKELVDPSLCLLQAKDSDDDDEVTVSVDRDRFMDEFFEQVRALVCDAGSQAGGPVGLGCPVLTDAALLLLGFQVPGLHRALNSGCHAGLP